MSAARRRDAAACVLASFAGPSAPAWVLRLLGDGLGGVVLFASNVPDLERVRALTERLRAEQPDVLLAIDEEGGDVTRLEADRGSSYPGALALGVADDPAATREVGAAIARDLLAVGVNLNLAPVADVNDAAHNPVVGVRSFGADPALVARHVEAFVHGTQAMGVAACAKHFPGHGDTTLDSHLALPTASTPRTDAADPHLAPFAAAIRAGVEAIMTAHVLVPALDDVPATLSERVLTRLLRQQLGFDGVVVTDALDMHGVAGTFGVAGAAVRALAAGADALCLGPAVDAEGVEAVLEAISTAGEAQLPAARLAEAAERTRRLGAGFRPGTRSTAHEPTPAAREAARRALRSTGTVQLTGAPLVLDLRPEPNIAAGPHRHGLGELLAARLPGTEVRIVDGPAPDPADPTSAVDGRPAVVVVRDAHRHAWEREAIASVLARQARAVIVETGLPAWQPQDAPYLATHGAGRASLEAAVDALLGSPPS